MIMSLLNVFICILTYQTGDHTCQTNAKEGIVHGAEYIKSAVDPFEDVWRLWDDAAHPE